MFVFLWFPFPSSCTLGYGLNSISLTTFPKFTYWNPLPPVPLNVTLEMGSLQVSLKMESLSFIGEGNDNPLHCSCLENPRDGEARWAAVSWVAQSRTRLKWLSSSSSSIPDTVRLLTLKKGGNLDIHIGTRRMPCEVWSLLPQPRNAPDCSQNTSC